MMTTELASAKAFLTQLSGGKPASFLCAVSGGLDSMCLLHLLAFWGREQGFSVTAAHFNHHLRGSASDEDALFVRTWCETHGVAFVAGEADVRHLAQEEKLSLEEAGRNARYAFLSQQRAEGYDFVLTAHHADDNAETMLLHLLRGTGLQGLTGIPAVRSGIARPFLRISRQTLAVYAKENGIPHVEDATNSDPDAAARNLLRLRVMPLLKELNPKAVENMSRTADLLAMDQEMLEHLSANLLSKAQIQPGQQASLAVSACKEQHPAVLQRAVLRLLAQVSGRQKDLTALHVESVCSLLENPSDKMVTLPYDMAAHVEEDALVIFRIPQPASDTAIQPGSCISFGSWRISLSLNEGETELFLPADADVRITSWNYRDRMTLPGSRGARSLKRLFAERGITPVQRDLFPVLRVNGQAAAVPGIGTDQAFTKQSHTQRVFITFYQETDTKENGYEK